MIVRTEVTIDNEKLIPIVFNMDLYDEAKAKAEEREYGRLIRRFMELKAFRFNSKGKIVLNPKKIYEIFHDETGRFDVTHFELSKVMAALDVITNDPKRKRYAVLVGWERHCLFSLVNYCWGDYYCEKRIAEQMLRFERKIRSRVKCELLTVSG